MHIHGTSLLLDTTGATLRAGISRGPQLLHAHGIDAPKGQSRLLPQLINDLIAEANLQFSDLTQIICVTGPGNFTGIRIGISYTRGLALGLGIPSIGVTQFDWMRAAFPKGEDFAPDLMFSYDARGQKIYLCYNDNKIWAGTIADIDKAILPAASRIAGFANVAIAKALSEYGNIATPLPFAGVHPLSTLPIAANRYGTSPAKPFYIRAADAALPRIAPPSILDA